MDINIDRIRGEMKNREQWLCWEAAMRDGKQTKLPKDPETGDFAQTDDPSTWGSFPNANGKVKVGQMDGIGFVFTEDDNYVGIDLDDCRDPETEEWEDWALDVMQDIGGWIEISPSGTGAHIILKGELPGDRNRKGNIEMYEDGRFFTVTGQLVDENGDRLDDSNDTPEIKEAQQPLDAVYDRFLAEDDESANETDVDVDPDKWGHLNLDDHDGDSGTAHSGGPNIDDLPPELRDIVQTAKSANNGYRFTQLWRGNWEDYYPSHSEGDMGFCDMLAFWFSGDPERMDRVFRESGLMRPKWDDVRYSDGSTYGERTIEKAIAEVDDHYDDEYYNDLVDDQDQSELESAPEHNGDDSSAEMSSADSSDNGPDETSDPDSGGATPSRSDSDETTKSTEDSTEGGRARGRSHGRGREAGRKRSQKRRDGIPDDIAESEGGEEEVSSSSPGPASDNADGEEEEDDEDFYTELNFPTEPDAGGEPESESDDEAGSDDAEDGQDEEELPSEDEAAGIFKEEEEEEGEDEGEQGSSLFAEPEDGEESSTPADTSTDEPSVDDADSVSSDDDDTESVSDKDESEDSDQSRSTSSSSESRSSGFDGKDKFRKDTETRLEDIEGELTRLDEELETAKAELRHDIELEDDKLERVYHELQKYETIIDKREDQLETMYQLLVLMCHVQPEPMFDRIENVLLNSETIPEENIFNESVEEIINHYHEDTSMADAGVDMGSDGQRGRSGESSISERPGASGRGSGEGGRVDDVGEVPGEGDGEGDSESTFLSKLF